MASPPLLVQQISKCTVKPAPPPPHSAAAVENLPLSVWDVAMLSTHYVQKGLLFSTPLPSVDHLAHKLKSSLSLALRHFHPLAGRLATERAPDGSGLHVSIDCSADRGGAEFIHASATGVTVAQVLAGGGGGTTSRDVPSFVRDFFPYNLAPSHDGHSIPLLAVQLTELVPRALLQPRGRRRHLLLAILQLLGRDRPVRSERRRESRAVAASGARPLVHRGRGAARQAALLRLERVPREVRAAPSPGEDVPLLLPLHREAQGESQRGTRARRRRRRHDLLLPSAVLPNVALHHPRARHAGGAADQLSAGDTEPGEAAAAALAALLRQLVKRDRSHDDGRRAAAPQAGMGSRTAARSRQVPRRRGDPGIREEVPREADGVPAERVRRAQRDDGELAEVRHVRVRLRVGEGGGGAERSGEQVRREGVVVPGEGGGRERGLGGVLAAGAHGRT
ncbi:putative acetyltransferase-like [Iris pallida]|uniref:Acetyltransferase-like n=1 Tax=Iris pallida TaxID=29817 RepID=A0AAX6GH36_IRIPA|nr:putative acetyltransferase-like [Iris pallida]